MKKILEKAAQPFETEAAEATNLRVLLLEDNARDVEFCIQELKKANFALDADVVDNEREFTAKIQANRYDIILSDYRVPEWSGVEAFRMVKRTGINVPFILVTGTLGEEAAVELIKEGIADYILKDRLARLPLAVHRALKEKTTRDEREGAIEALQRSEARVRRLVDSNVVGIAIGDLNGKLIEVNDACLRMLGYGREELLTSEMSWEFLTPPEYHEYDRRIADQLKSTGVALPWEKQFFHKNGTRVSVLIGVTTLVGAHGEVECISFILDISERKQLEQQLRQAQKMEAIGQLAGGIAHDFNNLLGVIIGYSEILLDRADQYDGMRSQCEEIKKAGDRAAGLTRQLLAFSRRQVLAPRVLNLNSAIVEIEKMLRRLIGEDIELRTNLDATLGSVKADPGQVEQIIMNLAVNARDAMPEGGTLLIETSNAELDERYAAQHSGFTPGSYVLLTVTDTGTGMDEETKTHIFEPFFTTKEPGKGTGLGLSTVYGVVNQSGGHVSVESEEKHGTSFQIYLPRVNESVQRTRANELLGEALRGTETILLVEDEEMVRTMTRNFLEGAGYTVLEAACGAAALDVARKHPVPIDLILTDVVMPGMNGHALAKKLIEMKPEIKVLYTSGYTGGFSTHSELLDAGACLVPKPYSRKTLLSKIREILK